MLGDLQTLSHVIKHAAANLSERADLHYQIPSHPAMVEELQRSRTLRALVQTLLLD